ncbi:MAG: hypothetical protein LWX83_03190 [Anaerolineae bacterium]|nr:hypothetical protein [Anaerolineae bacterium]
MNSQSQSVAPQPSRSKKSIIGNILAVLSLVVLFVVLVTWMNYPLARHMLNMDPPTLTPSATATFIPTRTLRPTYTPTPTPLPTATPLPASSHVVNDLTTLDPAIPGLMPGSIVLNVNDASIDPPLTNPQWVPSSSSIPGQEVRSSYYATFGAGAVTWKLDVPLAPGLYQLFVLDTVYSSAGSLDFTVREGNTPLMPLTDGTHINFISSQAEEDPQFYDAWRSLGIYNVSGSDMLSVSTSWGPRDEYTLVAVDRLLIEPLPAGDLEMINKLPADRKHIIVDDLDATIDGTPLLLTRDDTLSWNNTLQSVTNPESDVKFTYTMPYSVSPGSYEVLFWLPAVHNSGGFEVSIKANGRDLSSGTLAAVKQSDFPGGNWISMGTYDTSSPIYGNKVKFTVEFTIKGGTVGETGLDAIAFLGPPDGQEDSTQP